MSSHLRSLLLACALGCGDARSVPDAGPGVEVAGRGSQLDASTDSGGDSAVTIRTPPALGPQGTVTGPSKVDHCEQAGRSYKIGEWTFDSDSCLSRLCTTLGWDSHPAFCDQGTQCDGGPCDGCELGERRFPVGEGLVCEDGCNDCTCTGYGVWNQTLLACDALPLLTTCSAPPEADTTRPVFLAGQAGQALSLRANFPRGGCERAEMRACYATASKPNEPVRARVWLEPAAPLADCDVPFVAEDVFSLAPLHEQHLRERGEHGLIELVIGGESVAYEF